MKISELCEAAGVPRATVKYYLREGLLHPGVATSRTQAEYDDGHLTRLRLVRALTEVAGLRLDRVRQVLDAVDAPQADLVGVMAVAQQALGGGVGGGVDEVVEAGDSPAVRWLAARGWQVDPGGALIGELDRLWASCEQAGVGLDGARMDAYADAIEVVAGLDLDSVPEDPHSAARQVVLGTLLLDPLLACLRRLAQQHTAVTRFGLPQA